MALGVFGLSQNNGSSDIQITGPGEIVCTPIAGLIGMQAMLVFLRFLYGSGGQAVRCYVQSSADQGNTWFDIANVLFEMESETLLLNFSALTPKLMQVTPTDGALADDTAIDGLLTDRVRLKAVVTGTYASNTLLSARVVAR